MTKIYRLRRDGPTPERSTLDYASALNAAQIEAVTAGDGATLVIAGAGTGKTRTLIWRVAHLVSQGVSPDQIMLLTFTNRAAREMVTRVETLLQNEASALYAGTFHSIGRRLILEHAHLLGFPERCTVIDREDAVDLIKQCIAERDTKARRQRRFPKAATILNLLSRSINTARTVEDVLYDDCPQFAEHLSALYEILVDYQTRKLERGLLDFDDLLVFWQRLLAQHPEAAQALSLRFRHVLVDEYQDTNILQADIVDRMAAAHGNVMVVGDDAQAIYRFRGAEFRNILSFPERFENCRVVRLVENYRSTPEILALANESIRHNVDQFEKELTTPNRNGNLPALIQCRNEEEEAAFVAQRVLELRDEDVPLDKIAVLYRAHHHAIALELEFQKRNIPFVMRSGQRFFEQRHIKDVLAFLRVIQNPRDDLAAARVFSLAEGIGPATSQRMATLLAAWPSVGEALSDPELQRQPTRRSTESWASLSAVLGRLDTPAMRRAPGDSIRHVLDNYYRETIETRFDVPGNRAHEVETLADYALRYDTLDEFLGHISLGGELTGTDLVNHEESDEKVVLSTIHQAKGLEFNAVFVLSVVEEKFPIGAATFSREELEEERRLFYVAVTRAERELYLCRPLMGTMRGVGLTALRVSRFVDEVSGHTPPLIERWQLA